jgi:hypothetical protein
MGVIGRVTATATISRAGSPSFRDGASPCRHRSGWSFFICESVFHRSRRGVRHLHKAAQPNGRLKMCTWHSTSTRMTCTLALGLKSPSRSATRCADPLRRLPWLVLMNGCFDYLRKNPQCRPAPTMPAAHLCWSHGRKIRHDPTESLRVSRYFRLVHEQVRVN